MNHDLNSHAGVTNCWCQNLDDDDDYLDNLFSVLERHLSF